MTYPMPTKQFSILNALDWHIEGAPLFADMVGQM